MIPSFKQIKDLLKKKSEIELLPVNIANGQNYQNEKLKNAKVIITNWQNHGGWYMQTIHITSGYSLNTYGENSCGSNYSADEGKISYQYCSDSENFNITQLLIVK